MLSVFNDIRVVHLEQQSAKFIECEIDVEDPSNYENFKEHFDNELYMEMLENEVRLLKLV